VLCEIHRAGDCAASGLTGAHTDQIKN